MIVAGIDVGAISTKTVILNNKQFVAFNIMDTGLDPHKAAVDSMEAALKSGNLTREQVNFIFVQNMDQLLLATLQDPPESLAELQAKEAAGEAAQVQPPSQDMPGLPSSTSH